MTHLTCLVGSGVCISFTHSSDSWYRHQKDVVSLYLCQRVMCLLPEGCSIIVAERRVPPTKDTENVQQIGNL